MKTGRPRKPTALHVVEGTDRKDRRNSAEPHPEAGALPPYWVTKKARWAWKRLAPLLERIKVLTEADGEALALLCDAYAEFLEARELLAQKGLTYTTTTESGDEMIRPHPAVAMRDKAWAKVEKMLVHFGMTPAARAKVSVIEQGEGDPAEEFVRGRARNG